MKKPWLSGRGKWGAASALAAVLFAFSGSVSAQLATGITGTRHNLGSVVGNGTIDGRNQLAPGGTAEICVFCHTPHGADTSAPAPLWNKRLGVGGVPAGGGSYTTYATLQTPSLDGQVAEVGSVSMACLSCHDGTQAMDNIINAPGSGGYDATGGGPNGRTGAGWDWVAGRRTTAEGVMINSGEFISMLGTDLSNDHPIGIQYCGGAEGGGGLTGAGAVVSGTCRDSDFIQPKTGVFNSNQIFWIDTGGDGKQRTDLPLYNRTAGNLGPLVECASCHDPHVSEGQAGPAVTGRVAGKTFLRISNDGSAVCTSCHVK